jgi:hypothetical protein
MAKFPKVIYVHNEDSGNEKFLIATPSLNDHVAINETVTVARYVLDAKLVIKGHVQVIRTQP